MYFKRGYLAPFFMYKEKQDVTEYISDFEPPDNWEQLRDEEGEVMEGCYRVKPFDMSDEL